MDALLKSRMTEFLDPAQVEELQSIPGEGDLDLFADVCGLFMRTTPQVLKNLGLALEAGDAPAIARQAHILKGSSSNLGAFALSQKSHLLEQRALEGDVKVGELFEEVLAHYEKLELLLKDILQSPA